MRILYMAPFSQQTGYGQGARGFARALAKCGESIRLFDIKDGGPVRLEDEIACLGISDIESLADPSNTWLPTHVLIHAPPSLLHQILGFFRMRYTLPEPRIVAATTWETWDFPASPSFWEGFHRVIVPSEACFFQMHGHISDGLFEVVPHALETDGPEAWPALLDKAARGAPRPFTFLWHGDWTERKNPLGMIKAYWHAFSASDNVLLKMKLSYADEITLRTLKMWAHKPTPPIEFVYNILPQAELVALYQSADAFVTLSRGDAWGFPALHAASQQLPVIYTDDVGHSDFLQNTGIEIATQRTPVSSASTVRISAQDGQLKLDVWEPDGVTIDQVWAEPDLCAAADEMRRLYQTAGEGCQPFVNHWGTEEVGKKLVSALEEA